MQTYYKFTKQANADLKEITRYLAGRNPKAALEQQKKFTKKFQFICEYPHAGKNRPEFIENYLSIVEGNYIIFNLIEDFINIVRVLHSSRDFSGNQLT